MRILRFNVEGQIIKQDPNCDFSGLVPGTEGYVQGEFSFSPEWGGCVKVAAFYSVLGQELGCALLKDGKSCVIPKEALKHRAFKVEIVGRKQNLKLITNKVEVTQTGGKS